MLSKTIVKNGMTFAVALTLGAATTIAAADALNIVPAHALPDYTKVSLAAATSTRQFVNGFATGDFNEDGRMDLVVQISGPPPFPSRLPFGARVYLQDTNGAFTEKIEYVLPNNGVTWDLVAADFNEDGHLDVIMEVGPAPGVLDGSGTDMVLMLGKGDGTFQEATFLGLSAAGFFAVADLNADKHLDLVAGTLDGMVGVFAGAGNGTFARKATLDTQISVYFPRSGQVMVGDLNRDGKPDVAVAAAINYSAGNLDVFLGNGDGTFQEVIRTPNVAVRRGALGDFNGDGILDFAGDRLSPDQLEIWLGQGDGHFTKGKVYSLSGFYTLNYAVQVADLNYDGILDVVVSGESSSTLFAAPLSIFWGKGDGSFQSRQTFTQVNNGLTFNSGPALMDFDGDGLLDIVSMSSFASGQPDAFTVALSKGVKLDRNIGFLLNVQNSAPGPVVLETSANLADWTPLATNVTPIASWPVVDTTTGQAQRFYRTRRQ